MSQHGQFFRGGEGNDFYRGGGQEVEVSLNHQLDREMEVLQNHIRRGVLYVMQDSTPPIFIGELVQELVHMDTEIGDIDDLLLRLYHIHIPKLQDAGLIEYDQGSGIVDYHADDGISRLLDVTKALE